MNQLDYELDSVFTGRMYNKLPNPLKKQQSKIDVFLWSPLYSQLIAHTRAELWKEFK